MNGKHTSGFVARLSNRTKMGAVAVIGAAALAGGVAMSVGAGASVSPTTVVTSNGQAGYVAFGGRFQYVQHTEYLRASAEDQGAVLGSQLCSDISGDAVQVGEVPLGGGMWQPEWATGQLTDASVSGCAGDGLLTDAPNTISGSPHAFGNPVPDGHTLKYTIQYSRNGHGFNNVTVTAQDLTVDTSATFFRASCNARPESGSSCGFTTDWPQFTTVGVGVQRNLTGVSVPVNNKLVGFSKTNVRMYNGDWGTLGGSWWTAEQVVSQSAGTTLVSPLSSLNGSSFSVFGGNAVS